MSTRLFITVLIAAVAVAIGALGGSRAAPSTGTTAGGGCATDVYTATTLERDRQMTSQMVTSAAMPMAGDPMWAHAQDPAFLRALECEVREVESMFGRTDPYQR